MAMIKFTYDYPTSGVIVLTYTIFKTYQNAYDAVLKKKGIPPNASITQKWWYEEYEVTVIDNWLALEFASEQALTMFLLRWA
jgi:hypothetical protein